MRFGHVTDDVRTTRHDFVSILDTGYRAARVPGGQGRRSLPVRVLAAPDRDIVQVALRM